MEFMDVPPYPNKPTSGRSAEIDADVEMLKKHPGKSALLIKGWRSSGHSGYKKRGVVLTARRNADGTWDIYGWWPTNTSNSNKKGKK